MLKKAIGLLAAFSMAITSAGTMLPTAADNMETTAAQETADADETAASEEEEEALPEEMDELERLAIENCDPQYGKALKAREAYEAELELAQSEKYSSVSEMYNARYTKNATETDRYTGIEVTHNSRFDNCKRVYGIDVSQWQYNIDWNKVKADGIDFAIIRLGYRGYGSAGTICLDPFYVQNMQGAAAAGIDIGIYFYTQAITPAEARAEADFVIKNLRGYDIQLPVYFDIEGVDGDVGRLDAANLSKKEKTALCTAFCDRMIAGGYESGVYANKNWLINMIDGAALAEKYPIWLAHYNRYTDYTGTYDTWQYASTGSVKGISGGVDMNVDYRDGGDTPAPPAQSLPHTPTDISASFSNGKAVITWNDPSGADKYQVFKVNEVTNKYTKVATVTKKSYTAMLTDDVDAYCVRSVKSINGTTLYSSYSDIVHVSNGMANNTAPVRIVSTDYTSVVINFAAVSGAASYKVTDTSNNKLLATLDADSAGKSQRIEGLLPNRGTYLLVQGVKADNSTETVGLIYVKTKQIFAPENVKITDRTSDTTSYTTAKLSWNAVDGAQGYCIYQIKNGVQYYAKKTTKTSDTMFSLKAGTDYEFVVKAYVENNGKLYFGDSSSRSVIHCRPQTPSNVTASSVSNGIKLSFRSSTGADGYMIYRSTSRNGEYTRIGKLTGANKTSYTDTDTRSGSTYYYQIRAYRTSGSSSYYSEYTAPVSCTR